MSTRRPRTMCGSTEGLILAVLCLNLNVAHAVFHITRVGGTSGSWQNNRLECQRLGGDLATIKNAQENAEVLQLVQDHYENVGKYLDWGNPAYYIGLYMPQGEVVITPANGTFVWADGTAYSESAYANWMDKPVGLSHGCGPDVPSNPISECLLSKRPWNSNNFWVSMIYDDDDHLGEWEQYSIAGYGVCDIPMETITSKPGDADFQFFMSKASQTFAGVKADCAEQGGVIASIRNEKENYEVGMLYNEFLGQTGGVHLLYDGASPWQYRIWIGLEYDASTLKWVWEDETPFQYSHWKQEDNYASFEPQPNNLPAETNVKLKGTGVGGKLYPWWENDKTSWTDDPRSKNTNYGVCRKAAPWSVDQECTQSEFYSAGCNAYAACAYNGSDYKCSCPNGWTTSNDGTGPDGCEPPVTNCSSAQKDSLCPDADQCLEKNTFGDLSYECCTGASCNAPACEESPGCHHLAYCSRTTGSSECTCPEGLWGDGVGPLGCNTEGWTVRMVLNLPTSVVSQGVVNKKLAHFEELSVPVIKAMQGIAWNTPLLASQHLPTQHEVWETDAGQYQVTLNVIFPTKGEAETAKDLFNLAVALDQVRIFELIVNERVYYNNWWTLAEEVFETIGPRVYTWIAKTTSQEYPIKPTGLDVTSVSFRPNCLASGCWVVDVIYTIGSSNFNVFYLPKTDALDPLDNLSYDFDYTAVPASAPWSDYATSPASTYLPSNFPCTSAAFVPNDPVLKKKVTSCCIPEFLAMYRPVQDFSDTINNNNALSAVIAEGVCDLDSPPTFSPSRRAGPEFDIPEYSFFDTFAGMSLSHIVPKEIVDPYIGQYKATLFLDEVELRNQAGMLKGTVGVEHTVDTYVGLAEFKPTGSSVLDTFTKQVNIHLEKTSFFSVSSHGVNAYTFLEYVNMRLVQVLVEDADFSGSAVGDVLDDEAANRTVRTSTANNVGYVQVTFTMGSQYQPNTLGDSALIPLDSVRAGLGTFFDSPNTAIKHVCQEYADASGTSAISLLGTSSLLKDTFDDVVGQDCGPAASMCASPTSTPDSFVSFNIPLGLEVFDGRASAALDSNVFVDLVVNAIDEDARGNNPAPTDPNGGEAPWQVKTTLTASIPIVSGGLNIFCDGITAKTDLKDVANADIVVGTANSTAELTRLRIVEDIANTNLGAVPSTQIDTDSIESGLMTLVLKGNSSYFENGVVNSQGYSLELDDLITLHLMTDGAAPQETNDQCAAASAPKSVDCQLRDLLSEPTEDNLDSNGLDTDGYKLNGAFRFNVARGDGIAELEPTDALLAICPFNPTRPTGGLPLESCITRRDVRSRTYPVRNGAPGPTAMELLAQTGALTDDDVSDEIAVLEGQVSPNMCTCDGTETAPKKCCEPGFLQMILGENDYARDLAVAYVKTIHSKYALNGRYMRAYWINPGYEWTPTQTAGKSIFSISQKVYLFALITLDENMSRRRMLLATDVNPTQDTGSGAGGAQLSFPVARTSIMAQSFDVPAEKAVVFNVEMQLTLAEACMSEVEFVGHTRTTFEDHLDTAASAFHTVQVLGFSRTLNGVTCRRALHRQLLAEFSDATATAQMLIVFKDEGEAVFNDAAFADMAGITSVAADPSTAANVKVDATYTNAVPNSKATSEDSSSSSSSSSNVALIAGIAGGVGGAAVLLAGVMVVKRFNRGAEPATADAVRTINIDDLKAQLANEV